MNDIIIKKIRLKELQSFVESEEYKKFDIVPISRFRVASYLTNPRADYENYVLYMALRNNEIVGFRTILSDSMLINNAAMPFGWFSGNWVKPECRRTGISSMLYREVKSDWQSRLMYTNYAPESKALYDKSDEFCSLTENIGIRYYFKPVFYSLLAHRLQWLKKIRFVVLLVEAILKFILCPYIIISELIWKRNIKNVEVFTRPNKDILLFISNHTDSVFNRKGKEYSWIFDYPWVKEGAEPIPYPFSFTANKYVVNILVSRNSTGEILGVAIVKNINGKFSVPYYSTKNNSISKLEKAIIAWAKIQKADTLTIYNSDLSSILCKQKFICLFRKKMHQKYFVMSTFNEELSLTNNNIEVQDGDGDVIFT